MPSITSRWNPRCAVLAVGMAEARMKDCRKLPSQDGFECDARCWSGSRHMDQTLEGSVRELWAVRSKCNHILVEDGWVIGDSPTGHRCDPILEEAEFTADLACALAVASLGSLSVPRDSRCTFRALQSHKKRAAGCTGTKRPNRFSAETLCARREFALGCARHRRRPGPGTRLTMSGHCWQRRCLPTSAAL